MAGTRKSPPASSPQIRRRMERTRRRDTGPEMEIRRRLHAIGLRYRVDVHPIPNLRTRADIVFRSKRVAVFVDGCFWHGCTRHGTWPKSNRDWWRQKIRANVDRDRRAERQLLEAGWQVVRIWEHDSPEAAVDRILSAFA